MEEMVVVIQELQNTHLEVGEEDMAEMEVMVEEDMELELKEEFV